MSLVADLGGSLSLVPFLIYMHLKAEKRQDAQAEKAEQSRAQHEAQIEKLSQQWEAQIDQMMERADKKETELRDRFDVTVSKLDTERHTIQNGIQEEVKALGVKVDDVVRFIARPVR